MIVVSLFEDLVARPRFEEVSWSGRGTVVLLEMLRAVVASVDFDVNKARVEPKTHARLGLGFNNPSLSRASYATSTHLMSRKLPNTKPQWPQDKRDSR